MKILIWITLIAIQCGLTDCQQQRQWPVHVTSACYGLTSTFLYASCEIGKHIVVKNVYANAKPRYTNCPEESDLGMSIDPNCCICSPEDCQMEYSGVSKMKYFTECNGRQRCFPRVSWQPIGSMCSGRSFLLRSNYMVLEYYCVSDQNINPEYFNDTKNIGKNKGSNQPTLSSRTTVSPVSKVTKTPYNPFTPSYNIFHTNNNQNPNTNDQNIPPVNSQSKNNDPNDLNNNSQNNPDRVKTQNNWTPNTNQSSNSDNKNTTSNQYPKSDQPQNNPGVNTNKQLNDSSGPSFPYNPLNQNVSNNPNFKAYSPTTLSGFLTYPNNFKNTRKSTESPNIPSSTTIPTGFSFIPPVVGMGSNSVTNVPNKLPNSVAGKPNDDTNSINNGANEPVSSTPKPLYPSTFITTKYPIISNMSRTPRFMANNPTSTSAPVNRNNEQNDPYGVSGNSDKVSGNSNSVSGNSNNASENPNNVSGNSNHASGIPNNVSGNSNNVPENPNNVSDNSNNISGNSNNVSGNNGIPNNVSDNTNNMSGNSNNVSDNTNNVSGNPNNVAGNSNNVSGKPSNVSSKPIVSGDSNNVNGNSINVSVSSTNIGNGNNTSKTTGSGKSNDGLGNNTKTSNVSDSNNSMSNNPNNVSDNPNNVIDNVNNVSDNPNNVTENPNNMIDNANNVSDNTNNVSGNPNKVVDKPNNFSDNPNNVSDNPRNISGNPNSRVDYPNRPQYPFIAISSNARNSSSGAISFGSKSSNTTDTIVVNTPADNATNIFSKKDFPNLNPVNTTQALNPQINHNYSDTDTQNFTNFPKVFGPGLNGVTSNIPMPSCLVTTQCSTTIIISVIGNTQCPFNLTILNDEGQSWYPCRFNDTAEDTRSSVLLLYEDDEVDTEEPWLQFISSDHSTDVVLTCSEKLPVYEAVNKCSDNKMVTTTASNVNVNEEIIPGLVNWEAALIGIALLFFVTLLSVVIWLAYTRKRKREETGRRFRFPGYNPKANVIRSEERLVTPTNVTVRDQNAGVDIRALPRRIAVNSLLPTIVPEQTVPKERLSSYSYDEDISYSDCRPPIPHGLHRPSLDRDETSSVH